MHDFDLPAAFLRVDADDPAEGTLGVVLRRDDGGVAWRLWPVRTAGDSKPSERLVTRVVHGLHGDDRVEAHMRL